MPGQVPGLYGITNSNRDFSNPYYWGKNQFNSSFPVALCCYMRDTAKNAVSLSLAGDRIAVGEMGFDIVFGTTLPNDRLFFSFEDTYAPYARFVHDRMEHIDLVVREADSMRPLRPLEIKLTTLPDDGTSSLDEADYGSELVVRSPTMRYLALGIADASTEDDRANMRNIFGPVCSEIDTDWESARAMLSFRKDIFAAMEQFLDVFQHLQKPLLMQPVWKTIGKKPELADQCLDVFAWTDFAIARMVLDIAKDIGTDKKITRHQRAILRLARFMHEFSQSGRVYQNPIYDAMTYGTLNDKEFSVPGLKTNAYMRGNRLERPIVSKDEIKNIVLGGGQKYLSPERRFDSILFFSKELFNE